MVPVRDTCHLTCTQDEGVEMLVWATCTSTKNLRLRFGEGLDFDPVMDGWLAGTIAELLETHDLGLARIVEVSAPSARLRAHFDDFIDTGPDRTGTATLYLEGDIGKALQNADTENPFPLLQSISDGYSDPNPGHVVLASGFYDYSAGIDLMTSLLEPAAILQNLCQRGASSLAGDPMGAPKMTIYFDPDTLFVNEAAIIDLAGSQRRMVRFLLAARRD
ncbi:MAG: hypothetical protein WBA25_05040 [Jannaschia sp.]